MLSFNQMALIVTIRKRVKRSEIGFVFSPLENSALLFLHLLVSCPSVAPHSILSLYTCMRYVCIAEHAVCPWGVFAKVHTVGTSRVFTILPRGKTRTLFAVQEHIHARGIMRRQSLFVMFLRDQSKHTCRRCCFGDSN